MPAAEAEGQQFAEREHAAGATARPEQIDRAFGGRELGDLLPAAAAGRHQQRRCGGHRDRAHALAAGQHHRRQRRSLGAQAFGVGRVLDVAPGMHAAAFVEHRGADEELRVRRMRARPRRAGGGEERVFLGRGDGWRGLHVAVSAP
ncbi:MAG: hypothetical protein JNL85_14300 [Rubrivivax sp.]|nr:hypothetical protein [Rubrivivax sp.]